MPDHIHLFISTPPFESPTNIVKILKGVTAKRVFKRFPELKKKEFWSSNLWSPSYYVDAAGRVSAETIRKYIEEVKNRGCIHSPVKTSGLLATKIIKNLLN